MKVIGQQRNSRMCVICGLDNQFGVRAPFYNMTDGSVASPFRYYAWHQSYHVCSPEFMVAPLKTSLRSGSLKHRTGENL